MVFLDLSMPDFSGVDVVDALVEAGIMTKQKKTVEIIKRDSGNKGLRRQRLL